MNDEVADTLARRRRQWQRMTPEQQMRRVQYALLNFQNYAVRRRRQAARSARGHDRL